MIRVLGAKRVLTLVFLIAINAAVAAGLYLIIIPDKAKKERQLRTARGQVSSKQQEITRMQIEFEQLEERLAEYEELKERGFFSNQQRRQAELLFEKIQQQAGVVTARASVQSGVIEENEEAKKAEYKILMSPVKIEIEALNDIDVFKYIYLVEEFFPGHVSVTNLNLERKIQVTGPLLRSISSGENPVLVKADIEMAWRTMIPQSEVISSERN